MRETTRAFTPQEIARLIGVPGQTLTRVTCEDGMVRFEFKQSNDPKTVQWQSANGRTQFVSDMDTTHLKNALGKLMRREYGFNDAETQFFTEVFTIELGNRYRQS